jgi:hypothetical protein
MSDAFDDSRVSGQSGRDLSAPEPVSGLRFRLRSLFIATRAICVLLAIAVPVIRAAQRAAVRTNCMSNLKQIAPALHNYHDVSRAR